MTEKLLKLLHRRRVIRPQGLPGSGAPRSYLTSLAKRGQLQELGRGLYTGDRGSPSEHLSLAEISNKAPNAVICLLSAPRFHQIGTQAPSEVWIALDGK